MTTITPKTSLRVLLVDDSEVDAYFTKIAFAETYPSVEIEVVRDGVEALGYLRREGQYSESKIPNIVILDLNMPRKDGRSTLSDIKNDPSLRSTPVIVLTTSSDPDDIFNAYQGYANSYITKPQDFEGYAEVVSRIRDFWFNFAKLPLSS